MRLALLLVGLLASCRSPIEEPGRDASTSARVGVDCGALSCSPDEVCCLRPDGSSFQCVTAPGGISMQCDAGVSYACDGPEDCDAPDGCNPYNAHPRLVTQTVCSPGGSRVCHVDGDCTGPDEVCVDAERVRPDAPQLRICDRPL